MNIKQKIINRLEGREQGMTVRCPHCGDEEFFENDGSEEYEQTKKNFMICEMTCDKCQWVGFWGIDLR